MGHISSSPEWDEVKDVAYGLMGSIAYVSAMVDETYQKFDKLRKVLEPITVPMPTAGDFNGEEPKSGKVHSPAEDQLESIRKRLESLQTELVTLREQLEL